MAASAKIHITPAARPLAVLPAALVHCVLGRIVLLQRHAFVIHGGTWQTKHQKLLNVKATKSHTYVETAVERPSAYSLAL